ncbi:pirin family protein [Hymenobacter sp. BT186]|uniref:Pirin family protein n=1 Tax=Hymenobacter telluris TaxID=2816474 RepID=A0A939F228_9BACT|nr:pirin family protein [Hymenobacter telluris]MBO0359978.1 pirin family protein [Hymenobacter telluris]MBW3376005.1 pirin family protein [Hymenobacter norwichensis]
MLDLIIDARPADIGNGFGVRRILPYRLRRMLGPFIFMDHAGPVQVAPELMPTLDVLPHPHIGLSTVSYLFGGQVVHRDSLGVEQVIRPGEVNWMTAGRGIAHSERFEDPATLAGGALEMVQTWVALPEAAEEDAPSFTNYQPQELPIFTDQGVWMRLIAGDAFGLRNDVKTHSPLFYLHVVLQTGARFGLPTGYPERGAYVAKGSVEVSGRTYTTGQLLVFTRGLDPVLVAREPTTLMLLGGEPLGERYIWWNFVSSRKERIEQAKADWQAGRIALPPTDNAEFIPLPADRSRPAGSSPPPPPLS